MNTVESNQSKPATVGLILEGTYPYVKGGVSSWVHQIIKNFPDFNFSIIHLSSENLDDTDFRFDLPKNVIAIKTINIFSPIPVKSRMLSSKEKKVFKDNLIELHKHLKEVHSFENICHINQEIFKLSRSSVLKSCSHFDALLNSQSGWDFIEENYLERCPDDSFRHYYWTLVSMHTPIFHLLQQSRDIDHHPLYHSVSTGYAGFLASLLSQRDKVPLILSEHGIYTKERKIDLSKATPLYSHRLKDNPLESQLDYSQQLWVRYFEILGKMTYQQADSIISLYQGNQDRQWQDGACQKKTQIIPNGINIHNFSPLRQERTQQIPHVVALIGRVVPIKDIKTFIRGMKNLSLTLPEIQGWIIGPTDEDSEYTKECHELTSALNLTETIQFLGFQRLQNVLPQIGLITLTSISEAQPLVLLEGFAAGVPAIATDVGACRELIEGLSEKDQALGHAGSVIPIANPQAFSDAAHHLLTDETAWFEAQKAAMARVESFYTEDLMFNRYRELYHDALEGVLVEEII